MDTLFAGEPLKSTRFFDKDKQEIAYVVLEDEGDYWSILAGLEGQDGSIAQSIDKNIYHPNPHEYAIEMYNSACTLVYGLLEYRDDYKTEVKA